MLSDDQLIQILSASAPQGILARMYRQPVLWRALHNEIFLRKAVSFAAAEEIRWNPELLGLLLASEEDFALEKIKNPAAPIPAATAAKANAAWNTLAQSSDTTLDQAALAALALAADHNRLTTFPLDASFARILLACWYFADADPASVVDALAAIQPKGAPVITDMLLSNQPAMRAAEVCTERLSLAQIFALAQKAINQGEADFASALAAQGAHQASAPASLSSGDRLMRARLLTIAKDPASALAEADAVRREAQQMLLSAAVELAQSSESRQDNSGALAFWQEARAQSASDLPAMRVGIARALSGLGRDDEALRILAAGSGDTEEILLSASLHQKAGDSAAAMELARRVSADKAGQTTPAQIIAATDLLLACGDTYGAARILTEASRRWPTHVTMLERSAEAEAKCSHWAACRQSALMAWHLQNSNTGMLKLLANSSEKTGHHTEAMECYRELATLQPDDPEVMVTLAHSALDNGERGITREAVEHALRIRPEYGEAYAVKGMLQMADGDPEGSFLSLQKAVRLSPALAAAWKALADLHLAKGNRDAAVTTLRAGVDSAADPADLLLPLGQMYISEGKFRDATKVLERAAQYRMDDPEVLTCQAAALAGLQQTAAAEASLVRALEISPAYTAAVLRIVPLLSKNGRWEAARKVLEHAIVSAPESVTFHAALGDLLLNVYRHGAEPNADILSAALSELSHASALSSEPPSLHLLNRLGWAQALSGSAKESIGTFSILLNSAENISAEEKADAYTGLADALTRSGDISAALSSLQTAVQLTPANPILHQRLGQAYLESGLFEDALTSFRQASTSLPESEPALHGIAASLGALGRHEEAVAVWMQATELHPENADLWLNMAESCLRFQDASGARAALARCLQSPGSKNPESALRAARVLTGLKEHAEAGSVLDAALQQNPAHAELWVELGTTMSASGQWARAHEAFRRAAELEPESTAHLQHAAEALWADGRRSAAVAFWKKAAQLDPSNISFVYRLASAFSALGAPRDALPYFEKALDSSPDQTALAMEAAQTAYRAGDLAKAEKWEQMALSSTGASPDGLVLQARIAQRKGSNENALGTCNRLTAEYPQDARGWALLARSLADHMAERMDGSMNPESAKAALSKALELCPASSEAMQLTAEAALVLQDPWSALHCSKSLREALPDDADALLLFARAAIETAEASSLAKLTGADCSREASLPSAEEVRSALVRASGLGAEEAKLQPLFARAALVFSAPEDDSISHLESIQGDTLTAENMAAVSIAWWKAGNAARAAKAADAAAALFPASARARFLQGAMHYQLGAHDAALTHVQDAIARAPYWPFPQALAAILLAETGHMPEARTEMRKALFLAPQQAAWQHLLGRWLEETGDPSAAIACLQRAAELNPNVPEYHLRLARALARDGDSKGALAHYRLGLASLPAPSAAQLAEVGQVALDAGNPSEAYESFRLARERGGVEAPLQWTLGQARSALAMGHSGEAGALARQALDAKTNSPEAHILLAEVEESESNIPEAMRHLDIAASEMNNPLLPALRLARLWTSHGAASRAVMALQALVETYPDNDEAQHLLGEALAADGKMEDALRAAQKAADLAPRNADHWRLQGRIARQLGQLDQALATLSRAHEIAGKDFRNSLEMGLVFEAQRRWDLALDSYRTALKQAPESADILYRLGIVHKNMRSYNEATTVLRKVVQLEPKNLAAHRLLSGVMALNLVYGASAHAPIEAR